MNSSLPDARKLASTTALGGALVAVAALSLAWSGLVLLTLLSHPRAFLTPFILASLALNLAARLGLLGTGVALLVRSPSALRLAIATLAAAAAVLLLDLRLLLLNPLMARGRLAFRLLPVLLGYGLLVLIVGLAAAALIYLRQPSVRAEFGEERAVETGGMP